MRYRVSTKTGVINFVVPSWKYSELLGTLWTIEFFFLIVNKRVKLLSRPRK